MARRSEPITTHEPGSSSWSGIPGGGGSVKPLAINTMTEPTTAAINMPRQGKRTGCSIVGGITCLSRSSIPDSGDEDDTFRETRWELSYSRRRTGSDNTDHAKLISAIVTIELCATLPTSGCTCRAKLRYAKRICSVVAEGTTPKMSYRFFSIATANINTSHEFFDHTAYFFRFTTPEAIMR